MKRLPAKVAGGVLVSALALPCAACGVTEGGSWPGTSGDVKGSVEGPLLVSSGPGDGSGMAAVVRGELALSDTGCLLLSGMPVVWPEGTEWDEHDSAVRLPGGNTAPMGVFVIGGGGYYSQLSAIAEQFGQEIANASEPCLGQTGEVAVFNIGSDVSVDTSQEE